MAPAIRLLTAMLLSTAAPAWASPALHLAAAPMSTPPVNKYSQEEFDLWWGWLDEAEAAIAARKPWAEVQRSLRQASSAATEAGDNHHRHIIKHSAFDQGRARLRDLAAKFYILQIEQVAEATPAEMAKVEKEGRSAFYAKAQKAIGGLDDTLKHYITLKGDQDPEVSRLTTLIANAKKQLDTSVGHTKAAEAASVPMPADLYRGGDKASLSKRILAAWKQKHPDHQILGLRFYQADWGRDKRWEASGSGYRHLDISRLPVKVLVKSSAETASIYTAVLRRDHDSGNQIIIDVDREATSYSPIEMLLKNVKF